VQGHAVCFEFNDPAVVREQFVALYVYVVLALPQVAPAVVEVAVRLPALS